MYAVINKEGLAMSPFIRSDKEEEYFLRKEAEKLKKMAEKRRAETEAAEREELKKLHYMRCPKCGMELQEMEFQSIHIDKCFSCGGVWLDDGELDAVAKKEDENGVLSRFTSIFR